MHSSPITALTNHIAALRDSSTKKQSVTGAIKAGFQIGTYNNTVPNFNYTQEDYQGGSSVNYSHENQFNDFTLNKIKRSKI